MSVRAGLRRIVLSLSVTAAALSGAVCSVDSGGLSNGSTGQAGSGGGTGGAAGHGGSKGGSGGSLTGTGGSSTGGVPGTGGSVATGGVLGTGGQIFGTGGASGSGGQAGTGGDSGTGGSATGGSSATGGQSGSGGAAGGSGGTAGAPGGAGGGGTGGVAGSGGAAGSGGSAGAGGTGGLGGSTGGKGGKVDCSSYPSGTSMMLPSDNKLHCYWAHGNEVDWDSAEAICENEGGTLATILSAMENMTVLHLATQANLFTMGVPVAIGATDGKAANDQSGAGDYAWVTGEAWGYTNWHTNEPTGDCTGCGPGPGGGFGCSCDHWLMLASDGTWYDRNESTARPFVCEGIAR